MVIAPSQKETQKPLGESWLLNYEVLSEILYMEKHIFCEVRQQMGVQWNNVEGVYSVKIFVEFYSPFPQKYGPKIIFTLWYRFKKKKTDKKLID